MSVSDVFRHLDSIRRAKMEEPLLKSRDGNERRRITLEQVGAALGKMAGEENANVLELAKNMRPNSVVDSWDTLYVELQKLGHKGLADTIARECQGARMEIWQSVDSDSDAISQISNIGNQFLAAYSSNLGNFRHALGTMLAHMKSSFRPGKDMDDRVVDMARFGSGADDWMIKAVLEEMYLERGLYEQACGVCSRILEFEGYDMHRMMASTVVEDMLGEILAHLRRCEAAGHVDGMIERGLPISPKCKDRAHLESLGSQCLRLLERRAGLLGLDIVPDRREGSPLRRAADFALMVQARRSTRGSGEIGEHIMSGYPESHAFLELGQGRVLGEMAEQKSPLAQDVSAKIECQNLARIRNAECHAKSALDMLEPMLRFAKSRGVGVDPAVEGRWKMGIRGTDLWECLLEMDLYLRLVRAGSDVAAGMGPCGEGEREGSKASCVGLRVDGCLVEARSTRGGGAPAPGRASDAGRPGNALMDAVQGGSRLPRAGGEQTVLVVGCTGSEFSSIGALRPGLEARLGEGKQPGAVFFVLRNGGHYGIECLVNGNATTAIPDRTMKAIRGALALEALE